MSRIGILIVVCMASTTPGWAQQTREQLRAAAQAEKAKTLQPYVPGPVERYSATIQQALLDPPPIYTFIGGVFPGGAFALGPGARYRWTSGALADVHGAWSMKNYKMVDASLKLPAFAGRRIAVETHANWLEAPKVAFYGPGNTSLDSDRTSFLYRSTTAGGSARVQLLPVASVGGGLDYLDLTTGPGRLGPSIEQRFGPVTATGLGTAPTYTRSHAFAAIDWRDSPGYSRHGGLYRVDWSSYQQRHDGPYSFTRIDAELDQFVPLLRENWVLAFRALASVTGTDEGRGVPYFLMPSLGGGSELRGYPSWRFRDRHRLLLTGEYRWTAGQFVDMAIFLDAGKVVSRRRDLDLNDLQTSYGIGIRFHAPAATILRAEVARTIEGIGLVFAFGPSF
ncbi:MAG: BamA/TamA family outer membrane protein [Luteitalea sp.]|nr:BamA/TamA family outer membrane protein [Luteitalea sp.]